MPDVRKKTRTKEKKNIYVPPAGPGAEEMEPVEFELTPKKKGEGGGGEGVAGGGEEGAVPLSDIVKIILFGIKLNSERYVQATSIEKFARRYLAEIRNKKGEGDFVEFLKKLDKRGWIELRSSRSDVKLSSEGKEKVEDFWLDYELEWGNHIEKLIRILISEHREDFRTVETLYSFFKEEERSVIPLSSEDPKHFRSLLELFAFKESGTRYKANTHALDRIRNTEDLLQEIEVAYERLGKEEIEESTRYLLAFLNIVDEAPKNQLQKGLEIFYGEISDEKFRHSLNEMENFLISRKPFLRLSDEGKEKVEEEYKERVSKSALNQFDILPPNLENAIIILDAAPKHPLKASLLDL